MKSWIVGRRLCQRLCVILAARGFAVAALFAPVALGALPSTWVAADTLHYAPSSAADSAALAPVPDPILWLVSEDALDRGRLAEIAGERRRLTLLLRSTSTLLRRTGGDERGVHLLPPQIQLVSNSTLPFSMNDGAMWAGRGLNTRMTAGVRGRVRRLRFVFAPELVSAENRFFEPRLLAIERPLVPPDRSPWQFEWYASGPYSIDMPMRFGDEPIQRLDLGQSSISVGVRALEIGVATESNWWGPGISNALILSNNAPGFPHFFVRPLRSLETRVGRLDFRWLMGGLTESAHFDTTTTNDVRSLSAAAFTLELRRPAGLTVGGARSVWGTATGWGEIPLRWLDVLHSTGRPNNRPLNDSSLYPGGRDQVYSLFARWVFPAAGFETYAEWGRTEFPSSFRDFLVAPNHTQAYTLGLQWRRTGFRVADFWRLRAENTSVEQGSTFRDRPLGVWYTSRRVIQGYTNRGQPLGAAVGPGSSGQDVAIDYMMPGGSFGLKAGRIRFNEDVRSISPIIFFKRWCTHDIYLYWGLRASSRSRLGYAALDLTLANRYQPWFQVQTGCPRGDPLVDMRNNTLSLTFTPFRR